ncbi:UNVERIFIED_CONTAM: hypothetical protein K2H54_016183 [Gekko kuhli]
MGKPLSRPDCLRQNPPCVGKGDEEEDDINIEDCYVPQRSIYDTVRLNEQIDSGSKGSLSSRHFSDRTLPYSHRTLDLSTLCSNGALSSSSVFELRGREASKLDEKIIFDALKLNSDIIRATGLPKTKYHTEKKEHRRSWRMLVPPNFAGYANRSECSVAGTVDMSDLATTGQGKYGTNSLTSEDDDSGLCSPPAEREEKQDVLPVEQSQMGNFSSAEDICMGGNFQALSSNREQQISLLTTRSAAVNGQYQGDLHDDSQTELREHDSLWDFESNQEAEDGHCSPLTSMKKDRSAHVEWFQDNEKECHFALACKKIHNGSEINEPLATQDRMIEKGLLDISPQDIDICYEDAVLHASGTELVKYVIANEPNESNAVHTASSEKECSHQALELDNCQKANLMSSEFSFWSTNTQMEQTLDTVCNGRMSNKVFEKEEIEPLQVKQQEVNWLGQGLIQSAAKNTSTSNLECDLEDVNMRWKTLNKKVAQRAAQLQEALLHCGRFQDALESILSWLIDTEDLVANQKPPSAEFKVVKAQIQEQKLLQRLLDDRKPTVELIKREGEKIAESAEPGDKEKILKQLSLLESRWDALLNKAEARNHQLEGISAVAQQFHETLEPMVEWLTTTEKKLSNSEPIGTQASKLQQQISRHKTLEEDVITRNKNLQQAISIGQALKALSSREDKDMVQEKLDASRARYTEIQKKSGSRAELLQQAYCNAQIFGEDEVELMNWLNEVHERLSRLAVQGYNTDLLEKQHTEMLVLQEEILLRKQNVDQAIQNGLELLKQATGDEVVIIQDKLEGIKARYKDITKLSSDVSKTLEQALQLSGQLQSTHEELCTWFDKAEAELLSYETQIPKGKELNQAQDRKRELKKEAKQNRSLLDTLNEVSSGLLELVPWRAREGIDKMVTEDNERYKSVSDTITQKVEEIDAAILRSQQLQRLLEKTVIFIFRHWVQTKANQGIVEAICHLVDTEIMDQPLIEQCCSAPCLEVRLPKVLLIVDRLGLLSNCPLDNNSRQAVHQVLAAALRFVKASCSKDVCTPAVHQHSSFMSLHASDE